MNIFRTSDDPTDCARVLADQHVIKMAIETAQILATALRLNGVEDPALYRPTHVRHPCVLWVASNRTAAAWTFEHGRALCEEYQRRFLREHGTFRQLRVIEERGFSLFPDVAMTEAPKCVPEDLRVLPIHDAYRATLQRKYTSWKRPPRWTSAVRPTWLDDESSR